MKDLSKLGVPRKPNKVDNIPSIEAKAGTRKKKIIIVAIVCLLGVAVGSKMVNKHLKKNASEKAKIEKNSETPINIEKEEKVDPQKSLQGIEGKTDLNEKPNPNKMVFTFYDNLKKESVNVDVEPQKAKTQYKYTFIYQVASFRNMNEAYYYIRKMKKVGLTPTFKKLGSWIRMSIGPYESKRDIAPDIIKLQRIGLNGGYIREMSRTKIEPKVDNSSKSKK